MSPVQLASTGGTSGNTNVFSLQEVSTLLTNCQVEVGVLKEMVEVLVLLLHVLPVLVLVLLVLELLELHKNSEACHRIYCGL